MEDKTKFEAIYALTEAIREAAKPGVQAWQVIDRLAHAIQCIMTDLPVEDRGL